MADNLRLLTYNLPNLEIKIIMSLLASLLFILIDPYSSNFLVCLLFIVSLMSVAFYKIKCNLLLVNKLKLTCPGAWWEICSLAMPATYSACVDIVQVFDLMPVTVTCYTVSRDRTRRCSTVHLDPKNFKKNVLLPFWETEFQRACVWWFFLCQKTVSYFVCKNVHASMRVRRCTYVVLYACFRFVISVPPRHKGKGRVSQDKVCT